MRIALHGKYFSQEAYPFIKTLGEILSHHQADLFVSEHFASFLSSVAIKLSNFKVFAHKDALPSVNLMISVGGDGTLLQTVAYIGNASVPILGINTGRLGFLSTMPKENIAQALEDYFQGRYGIDERTLIRLAADMPLTQPNFALNEIAILKKDSASMITVQACIDGIFLSTYWSDGLIIATPTGSTGYSLSCGGPIVLPHSQSLVITPISPHNLSVRPLVISDEATLTFKIKSRHKNILISLDSRSQAVDTNVQLTVKKEAFKIRLVKIGNKSIFDTLRQKLHWGLDARN